MDGHTRYRAGQIWRCHDVACRNERSTDRGTREGTPDTSAMKGKDCVGFIRLVAASPPAARREVCYLIMAAGMILHSERCKRAGMNAIREQRAASHAD